MSCNTCHGQNVRHCPDPRHRDEMYRPPLYHESGARLAGRFGPEERLSLYWAQREEEEQGKPTDEQLAALISLAHTVFIWQKHGTDTELHDDYLEHKDVLAPLIEARDQQLRDSVSLMCSGFPLCKESVDLSYAHPDGICHVPVGLCSHTRLEDPKAEAQLRDLYVAWVDQRSAET